MITKDELLLKLNQLPGERAHYDFSPMRGSSQALLNAGAVYRESAVAIILFPEESDVKCIVTKRQSYEGKHSGEISFPGGKKEESDISTLYTAMRETKEEIGFDLQPHEFLKTLTPVYIPVSQFLIAPQLFWVERERNYELNQREVNQLIELSLKELFSEQSIERKDIMINDGLTLKQVPHFVQKETAIWGATAVILNELKYIFLNR